MDVLGDRRVGVSPTKFGLLEDAFLLPFIFTSEESVTATFDVDSWDLSVEQPTKRTTRHKVGYSTF